MFGWIKKKHELSVIVFMVFLFICWLGLAYSFVRIFLGVAGEIPKLHTTSFKYLMIDVYFDPFLKRLIFLWILIHLQGIVLTISRKDPFNKRNSARIRKIAYGAFAFAIVDILNEMYWYYWLKQEKPEMGVLVTFLRGDVGRMILVGVGILIIAKAFKMGIKLQEDQNLTV
jgi:hypothetical protein